MKILLPVFRSNINRLKFFCCLMAGLFPLSFQAGAQQKTPQRQLSRDLDSIEMVVEPPPQQPVSPYEDLEEQEEDAEDNEEDQEKKSAFTLNRLLVPDSVKLRSVDPSLRKAQKEDDAFWYADHDFGKKKNAEDTPGGSTPLIMRPAFQTFLWVVAVAGFIAILFIFLSDRNNGIFRRDRYIGEEQEDSSELEDIFSINYQKEIEKAERSGNYRLAVRLMFLRLLRDMTDRNIISYQQERTNSDYLAQLQPTSYYPAFFRLTRHYEYCWYGRFGLDAEKFGTIRGEFHQFERMLNKVV